MARGDAEGAARDLALAAAAETHLAERDYVALLRPLEEALTRAGDCRGALTVIGYEAIGKPAAWTRARALLPKVPPADRARAAAAQGYAAEAAREMEDAGNVAAAAIFREGTADFAGARALWSRLTFATDDDRYVAALVRLNIARCAKRCGDPGGARDALVASTRLLEEAADHFEGIGQSERAFDCFQVLTQVGRESGAFEDMLEGFVNCIRILREDHLGTFALEYFEEAIATAAERGETSAASTFARDAANYARSQGLADTANGYSLLQAELWQAAAKQHQGRGAPVDIVENALLAAVLAYGEVGQHARVGALYAQLASLKLGPARREQYERAKERYVDAKDEEIETSRPKRPEANISDVWHADVLEWEQRGSAAEVCADVLLDKRWPDLIRRRAMLARLTALEVEAKEGLESAASLVDARVRMAERLSELQVYAVLAPLEALFARPERRVRVAVVRALQSLYFKRTFVTLRAALRDADAAVVEQGTATVKALHFPHAFHPLARIVRESPQPSVRAAALWGMAQIDTVEAAEFLLGVLDNGAPVDQAAARGAVKEAPGTTFAEVFRQATHGAGAGLKANLAEVMKGWRRPG
jgi:hypothetical protein